MEESTMNIGAAINAVLHRQGAAPERRADAGDATLPAVELERLGRYREFFTNRLTAAGYDARDGRTHVMLSRWVARAWFDHVAPLKGLLLIGGTGSGKTTAMAAVCRLLSNGNQFATAKQLSALAHANRKGDAWKLDAAPRWTQVPHNEDVMRIGIYALDDLGFDQEIKEFGGTYQPLADVIDWWWRIYERDRRFALLATSNLNEDGLKERYGERAWSRLQGMCYVVPCTMQDQRVA